MFGTIAIGVVCFAAGMYAGKNPEGFEMRVTVAARWVANQYLRLRGY